MKKSIVEIQKQIDTLTNQIEDLQDQVDSKTKDLESMDNDPLGFFEDEITELHDNMINDCYGHSLDLPFSIGDIAEAYKENDPISYRCSVLDYADRFDCSAFEEYKEIQEEIETLESEIADLESKIEDLETEE